MAVSEPEPHRFEGTEGNGSPPNATLRVPRIALYSHDTMGIGHMRRNLLIAQALAASSLRPSVLSIAGAWEASAFPMPANVDCLTLPSFFKQADGQYQSRRLNISLKKLVHLRAETIRAALLAFEPDVLIVDKVPRGALCELDLTLDSLHAQARTRCVLGLRDVLDDPELVRGQWSENREEEAIRTHYDAIWVYGDPRIYDPLREYAFSPEVASRVRFAGYLDRRSSSGSLRAELAKSLVGLPPCDPFVLCMVGGGQDGVQLAETFLQSTFPAGTSGVLLMGPYMPPAARQRLQGRAAGRPHLRVLEFVTDADLLLSYAERVVAMGGYNTICEVLSFAKHALIVPRVSPRREQLIRAERLRDLGFLDMLHPDSLNPGKLSEWLARKLPPLPALGDRIDLNGLTRIPQMLEALLAGPPRSSEVEDQPVKDVVSRVTPATGRAASVTPGRQ